MLKLGLLIPNDMYMYIKEACVGINANIDCIPYENLYELKEIYIKKGHLYDGIITGGPIGYGVLKENTKITMPMSYLEVSKYELCKCFFKVQKENPNIDFSRVYIDFLSTAEKNYWLEDIFEDEEEPIIYPLDYSDINLYEIFKERYDYLSENKKIDLIITRISNMQKYLDEKNIPYIFLAPSLLTIKEKIEGIIKDIESQQIDKNKMVMIKIENISTTRIIFKKKMEHLFKNYIAQIIDDTVEVYMLKKDFINFDMSRISLDKVNIGFGSGEGIREARVYAEESFKKNKESHRKFFFLIDSEGTTRLDFKNEEKEERNLIVFNKLNNLNIIGERASGIVEILKRSREFTIDEFAKYLNLTERTAGRILEKLEKEELVEFYIKKISRGRPKKIYTRKEMK